MEMPTGNLLWSPLQSVLSLPQAQGPSSRPGCWSLSGLGASLPTPANPGSTSPPLPLLKEWRPGRAVGGATAHDPPLLGPGHWGKNLNSSSSQIPSSLQDGHQLHLPPEAPRSLG
ncbi:chromosome alignment-maintaining phosphoprotein 1-like [Pongo pygmaeus]|uniref:chromosome alignment-maintaining phosphoprotein 1-like n=1 Tax=Pongo pygmaeus TaxID=9600 RepID=UPI0023E0D499|nr:chromosome alignment-maintaining phosphoprotein 1-like [Pongo pygmaeus]